jgi:hypothetical protein
MKNQLETVIDNEKYEMAVTECCIDFYAYLASIGKYLPFDIDFRTGSESFNKDVSAVFNKLRERGDERLADFMLHMCCWERLDFGNVIGDKYFEKCSIEPNILLADFKKQATSIGDWGFEPHEICELAMHILSFEMRGGSFLQFSQVDCDCQASEHWTTQDRTCFVDKEDMYFLYKMLLYMESASSFETVCVMKCDPDYSNAMTFDAVLMDTIWSLGGAFVEEYESNISVWDNLDLAIDHMKEKTGVMIAIVPNDILTSEDALDVSRRKSLLGTGLIEKVIWMNPIAPECAMLVISDDNHEVKMYNYRDFKLSQFTSYVDYLSYERCLDCGCIAAVQRETILNDEMSYLDGGYWLGRTARASEE